MRVHVKLGMHLSSLTMSREGLKLNTSQKIKIAAIQVKSVPRDKDTNLQRALEYIEHMGEQQADLVIFPELYLTGYTADKDFFKLSESVPGQTTHTLAKYAAKFNVNVIMGMPTLSRLYPNIVYNSAVFINPEGVIQVYNKTHLATVFAEGVRFQEGLFFKCGREYPVFDTKIGRIGILICMDALLPEPARILAAKGAELIVGIFAAPKPFRKRVELLCRARAAENGVAFVVCNNVGVQDNVDFFGGSMIINSNGDVDACGKYNEEDVVIGNVDFEEIRRFRSNFAWLRDRRPWTYGELCEYIE